jgi:hypothetical protein
LETKKGLLPTFRLNPNPPPNHPWNVNPPNLLPNKELHYFEHHILDPQLISPCLRHILGRKQVGQGKEEAAVAMIIFLKHEATSLMGLDG